MARHRMCSSILNAILLPSKFFITMKICTVVMEVIMTLLGPAESVT